MVYVKMVNKRKFIYITEARLHASAASCLGNAGQSNKSGKASRISKVWLHF